MIFDPDSLDKITEQAKQKLSDNNPYADLYSDDNDNVYDKDSNEIDDRIQPDYLYTEKINDNDIEYSHPDDTLDDDAIFDNGPSIHEVDKWKKQYSDCNVFVVELAGEMFVCRTITRPEYRALVTKYDLDQIQREELICMTCILFPYNLTWDEIIKLKGGIPSTLASIIMEHSGFTTQYGVSIL